MTVRRSTALARILVGLLLLSAAIVGQAPGQSGTIALLSREGRRTLAVSDVQGHAMVGLDDLSTLFQLTIREDTAAHAVTVSYKNQTIVLTPDQSLASLAGRLVSLPAPLTRQGRRWLVPVEFISRGLAPIYAKHAGFRSYEAIKTGADSAISISTWDTEAHAMEAVTVGAEWVASNIANDVVSAETHVGTVVFSHR